MSADFEDPRKTELRQRCADAADAAGYEVDSSRAPLPYPKSSSFNGSIRADVSSKGADGKRVIYFVRVDGEKPLPGWLTNIVVASFSMRKIEVYVVAEKIGEQLRSTCAAVGCGLLQISATNELEKELAYAKPERDADLKAFEVEVREVRRLLETKLDANLGAMQEQFTDSRQITQTMSEAKRTTYLESIETSMLSWRAWGEELSGELDLLAGEVDEDALATIKARVIEGPEE
jgi:hypothetical protein